MIALGSDHGGYDLKCRIMEHLKERGTEVQDFGCFDKNSCDYPDFGLLDFAGAKRGMVATVFRRGAADCGCSAAGRGAEAAQHNG